MKFIEKLGEDYYAFETVRNLAWQTFNLHKEEVISIAKTAIEQGLIDPRDYLPKEEMYISKISKDVEIAIGNLKNLKFDMMESLKRNFEKNLRDAANKMPNILRTKKETKSDSKLSETLKEVIVRRDLENKDGDAWLNNPRVIGYAKEEQGVLRFFNPDGSPKPEFYTPKKIDPFYCMKSKAVNFFKEAKKQMNTELYLRDGTLAKNYFNSNNPKFKALIHKFNFQHWSDSLKILKERGYATYEKNEKGRIVNIRLLF